jgi:hypothetical protein
MSQKKLIVVLALLASAGCNKELKGKFVLSNPQQDPVELRAGNTTLTLRNNDSVSVNVSSQGWFFDSTLKIKTAQGVSIIPVPKTAYLSKKSFNIGVKGANENYDVKGYETSEFVRQWNENGEVACALPGDCGNFVNTYDGNGNLTGMYWVSATCWGRREAVLHKELYNEGYKVEFQPKGYFVSNPEPEIQTTVREYTGDCH